MVRVDLIEMVRSEQRLNEMELTHQLFKGRIPQVEEIAGLNALGLNGLSIF